MTRSALGCLFVFPVSGGRGRAGLGPALALNLIVTDQSPVPNCPGLRPGQYGTGFESVRVRFTVITGPKAAPEARPRDRKHD